MRVVHVGVNKLNVEDTLPDRLRVLAEEAGSGDNLSRISGVPRRTLENYLSGKSSPKAQNLYLLAKAVGASLDWLIAGEGSMYASDRSSSLIQIPRHNIQLSAGHGSFVERSEVLNYIPFNADFFDRYLQRDPKDMIIVDARGESMEPTMRDRDLLMIDTSSASKSITSAIYGFTFGQDVFVKRLFVTPDNIIAKSDNKDYGDFTIGPDNMDQFHPIGRVVWIGRTL